MYELKPAQPARPYVVSFDTETFLIRPGLLVPKLVCLSWHGGTETNLLAREDGLDWLEARLRDPDTVLVTHNGAYDFAVCVACRPHLLPLVFDAYQQGRVRDTRIRQKLTDISKGEHKFHTDLRQDALGKPLRQKTTYTLAALAWRHYGHTMSKNADTYRLRYGELDGVAIEDYPEAARTYAMDDALWTYLVFEAQTEAVEPDEGETVPCLPNELPQTCATWVLHLMSAWGLRTNRDAAHKLRDKYKTLVETAWVRLKAWGLVRENGSKDMKAIRARVEACYAQRGLAPPLTAGGAIATDSESLKAIDDEQIAVLCDVSEAEHTLTSFVPVVLGGVDRPINPGFNALVESGRTSCEKPNLHNPPRRGGVRECFEPRPGFVYVGADYSTLELRTLAQCCLLIVGHSEMAEAIKRGEDLHASLAAKMRGMDYSEFSARLKAGDKAAEDDRQFAKIGNFGFGGGMGGDALVDYARGYGMTITKAFGNQLKKNWLQAWPEMRQYFQHISAVTSMGDGTVFQLLSGRVRGGLRFNSAANTYFQGLAADLAKDALWHVSRECYLGVKPDGSPSPLAGSRPVIFLHDEIILETPCDPLRPELASDAAKRLTQVMEERGRHWCPDVPIEAGAVIMRNWGKGAKGVHDDKGNMLPSKPIKVRSAEGKEQTKWVADV